MLILDFDDARALERALSDRDFDVARVTSVEHVTQADSIAALDLLIIVSSRDVTHAIDACRRLAQLVPRSVVIVVAPMSGFGAVSAVLTAGADEFLPVPVEIDDLLHAWARARARRTAADSHFPDRPRAGLGALIGASALMQEMYRLIERVAPTDSIVLVSGETGTGKELVARTLHALSGRQAPFVAINCAGIPEALLESELFGHARGAFTDAKAARPGLLETARGGTVLLDEIGEMSLALQAKLLRALQERRFRPLGSDRELAFDARILVATNRDLETEVAAGRFRPDLYFRIDVINIAVPRLRARETDVLLLAEHFLARSNERSAGTPVTLTAAAASKLLAYPWPGNVRELQNCIERAVTLCDGNQIDVGDLPERIRRYRCTPTPIDARATLSLAELEKRHISDVLESVGGRKGEASRLLGIDRKTLYRKLNRYNIRMRRSEP